MSGGSQTLPDAGSEGGPLARAEALRTLLAPGPGFCGVAHARYYGVGAVLPFVRRAAA